MAYCGSRCPYHWHDDECEYCAARGNEVIDTKNYSYKTCPYYQEIQKERQTETPKKPRPDSSGGGCGSMLLGLIFLLIIGAIVTGVRSCVSRHNVEPENRFTEEPAESAEAERNGFVFPDSGTELISPQEAESLSDGDLSHAINEIYARHGYIFQNDAMREYYEQFSWYTGEIPSGEFSVDCFNEIERENWNLLVQERDRRKSG